MANADSQAPSQSSKWPQIVSAHLRRVREGSPLVQCITNMVSMDLVANTLLAAGASPAMIHCLEEIPDFTPKVGALYINVGTLSSNSLPSMRAAAELANAHGIPWVLDPVAAGASTFRLNACIELIALRPSVIRGNGSEILTVSNSSAVASKGADSCHESLDAVDAAKSLATRSGSIVAVSGAVDIVTDGNHVVGCRNGVPLLQKITATGCSVTALIAAFVSVNKSNPLEATASALSIFGIAAEIAMECSAGPASLRMNLTDSLHRLGEETIIHRSSVSDLK